MDIVYVVSNRDKCMEIIYYITIDHDLHGPHREGSACQGACEIPLFLNHLIWFDSVDHFVLFTCFA